MFLPNKAMPLIETNIRHDLLKHRSCALSSILFCTTLPCSLSACTSSVICKVPLPAAGEQSCFPPVKSKQTWHPQSKLSLALALCIGVERAFKWIQMNSNGVLTCFNSCSQGVSRQSAFLRFLRFLRIMQQSGHQWQCLSWKIRPNKKHMGLFHMGTRRHLHRSLRRDWRGLVVNPNRPWAIEHCGLGWPKTKKKIINNNNRKHPTKTDKTSNFGKPRKTCPWLQTRDHQKQLFWDFDLVTHVVISEQRGHWIELFSVNVANINGFFHEKKLSMGSSKPQ